MPSSTFGPFRPGIDAVERVAQLRCLQGLVRVFAGEAEVVASLRDAEREDCALAPALAAFDKLPALTRRRVLGTFAFVHDPRRLRSV